MCVCVCVCVCVCKEARAHVHLWNSWDFSNVPEQIVEATLDLGKNMLFRDVIANLQDGAGSSCLLEFMPLCSSHFLCSTRTRLCDQETISEVMMVCHFYIQIIKGFIKTTVASILSHSPPTPPGLLALGETSCRVVSVPIQESVGRGTEAFFLQSQE